MSQARFYPETPDPEPSEPVSKTRVKAMMLKLQDLGEALTRLSSGQMRHMPVSDRLAEAVVEYGHIRSHSARRRQLQFIGRLMRDEDANAIRAVLEDARGESSAETARLYRLENLRQRLLDNETETLAEIAKTWPTADITHLRQLRRATLKETAEAKPPRHFRALFQALKALEQTAVMP